MAPAISGRKSHLWVLILIAICILAQRSNAQSAEASSIQTLHAEQKANADSLKSMLTRASSPEQRRQAIIAFQQKNETIQKQFAAIRKSHATASIPSQRGLDALPPDRKAAIEQWQSLAKQLKQITAPGNGMTPAQRASALANWRKSWVTAENQFQANIANRVAAGSPKSQAEPDVKTLSPGAQKVFAGIQQSENERNALKVSMTTMSPEQRSAALRQWASTMQARLKAYRDQLKAARTASFQSTTP
jgi:hypothetical protein